MMNITKHTFYLTERAERALELAAHITGLSKVDTVNRALQAYAYLEQEKSRGGEILVRDRHGELTMMKYK